MNTTKVLVMGGNGQLGNALRGVFPDAEFVDREEFDITDPSTYQQFKWSQYDTIINAAAYTAVDAAETPEGRRAAWSINATAVKLMSAVANEHGHILVHISSDYVFDGATTPHTEHEPFSPLSVYGQTKAAGDIAASGAQKHYIIRTSWVIGEGNNFVRTMKSLANKGIKPSVVNDQVGRLTFTKTLAEGIKHLLDSTMAYGTYNLTNTGDSVSWADIAKVVYEASGASEQDVTGVSTDEYYQGKDGIAPRPLQSTLDLAKIESTGFKPAAWQDELVNYMQQL